jgi:Flp pilus assembly protein TadB
VNQHRGRGGGASPGGPSGPCRVSFLEKPPWGNRVRLVADPIARAITLFERGRMEEAAHLLAIVRRSAEDADEQERFGEIDDVIGQMQAHLSVRAREAFDLAIADESATTEAQRALRRGELRSIVQSVGVVASVGAVAILVSGLFRWPDTLLYVLLVAVTGPLVIVILSLPIVFVDSLRPRMRRRRAEHQPD